MKNDRHSGFPIVQSFQRSSWIDLSMEAVWLLTVFLLPLVFFPNLYTTFELAKAVVFKGGAILLMLLWFLKYLSAGLSPMVHLKRHRLLWTALAFFCAWYVLTTIVSVAPALSFFGWYPRFQGLLMFFSTVAFGTVLFFELKTPKQRDHLLIVMMAGFLVTCGVALLQKFLPGFLQWWDDAAFNGRIYGTMANPNYLAGYAVMVIPLLVANMIRKNQLLFSAVCFVAGSATLLFTLSRSGFLAMFLSLLFFFVVFAWQRKAKKALLLLALLPVVAGGMVWYVIAHQEEAWVQNFPFIGRFTTSEENMSSTRTRLEIWPAAMRQIMASPLIGYGPETFAVTFPAFAPSTVNSREDAGEIADHAHNELLDIGVQSGLPAMIAYLCFLAGLLVAGTRSFLKTGEKDPDALVTLGLCSAIVGLFVANEFGFSVTVHWVLLATFVATLLHMLHGKDFSTVPYKLGRFWKIPLFVFAAGLSLGMFWLHDVRTVEADAHMRKGYDLIQAGNLGMSDTQGVDLAMGGMVPGVITELEAAAELAPTEAFYSLNLAHFVLGRLYEGHSFSTVQIADALDHALHAARLRGYDGFSVSMALEMKKFSGLTF